MLSGFDPLFYSCELCGNLSVPTVHTIFSTVNLQNNPV